MSEYKGTETIQLIVKKSEVRSIINEWAEHDIQSDVIVRKAKTRGHVVVETKDVVFSAYVQRNWPSCQVIIKE